MKNRELSFKSFFLIIFICYIPWMIAFFPGIIVYDSCGQLLMCIWGKLNDHHPILSSLMLYFPFICGRMLFHSDNIGVFIYIMVQMIAEIIIFAYCLDLFRKKKSPRLFILAMLAYFCIFPLFSNISVLYCKDVPYALACLLCFASFQLCYPMQDSYPKKDRINRLLWIFSIAGICIFRHEGKFIAVLIILLTVIFFPSRKSLAIKGLVAIIAVLVCNMVIIQCLNVGKGSVREMLSVPTMITAAYLDRYPNEVDDNETRILYSVFDITDLNELSQCLDYDISDEIKAKMYYSPDRRALKDYLVMLGRNFFKHPGLYLDVICKHSDGYFNPFAEKYEDVDDFLYILGSEEREDDNLRIHFSQETLGMRKVLRQYVHFLDDTPVIGLLFNPDYTLA